MGDEISDIEDFAADIRAVDGNHDLGAAALAEKLIEMGYTKGKVGYPYESGPHLILGPELFTGAEGTPEHGKLMWKGVLYVEAKPVVEHPPLKTYREGQQVMVLKNADWMEGFIQTIDPGSGNLHVHTKRGPVTIGATHNVSPLPTT